VALQNTFGLAKYKNGIVYPITSGNIPSPETITDTLLGRVSVVDDKINIFINDNKIFEYQDNDPLLNGKVGLGVIWNLQARFDDVVVSGSSVVPEPSSMLLLGLGGLLLRRNRRRVK
jgi:hypothetical protein